MPLTVTGVQVPAGTIRDGEAPEDAVLRETREETGRDCFAVRRFLGTATYDTFRRHFYELVPTASLPEAWEAAEHHDGLREPTAFAFSWIPVSQGHVLAGGLGALLGELSTS